MHCVTIFFFVSVDGPQSNRSEFAIVFNLVSTKKRPVTRLVWFV